MGDIPKCSFVSGNALILLCFLPLTTASLKTPGSTLIADNTLNDISGGYSYKVKIILSGTFGILYRLDIKTHNL